MSILAIGDSFTFGAELPDVPTYFGYYGNDYHNDKTQQQEISAPSKYAWPSVLATKMNTDVVNLGLVGGSNDRIFRLAVRETIKQKYDVVVCAWTSINRLDITLNNKEIALSVNSAAHWSKEFPWAVDFITNHYSKKHTEETWLTKVITLQEYFKSISQPYIFLKAMPIHLDSTNLFLEEKIDRTNCVEWESSMMQWCKKTKIGVDGHFLEDGHRLVAEKLFTHLQNKQ